jgi:adenylate cyclase
MDLPRAPKVRARSPGPCRMSAQSKSGVAPAAPTLGQFAWEREFRLWAGLILFAFLTTHLLNHALGVFGTATMEIVQLWRVEVWRSWPGTIALYGAAFVHVSLALKRIASRRTWRMPLEEAAQIVLGITIPVLLLEHVIGTRYSSAYLGVDDSYPPVLKIIRANSFYWQIALVLVAWFHGVIGIHYAFRTRPWFERFRAVGLVLAFLVPVLAIAGFLAASREAMELDVPAASWTVAQTDGFKSALQLAYRAVLVVAGGLFLVIVLGELRRRIKKQIPIRYTGHGQIYLRPGSTLLEASRESGIPHPSVCGGRARCSTCRVLVLSGLQTLPEPGPAERAMLDRISAPKSVRVACQIRPTNELAVQILLPVVSRAGQVDWEEESYKWGVGREVTILFVDIRGFTTLSSRQLPHDTVLFVNRFIVEMRQAVEARGGRVGMFLSDGLMAIFGLGGQRAAGGRAAIMCATDMLKAAHVLNEELGSALPMPLRIGIGIHTGQAVIARVGDPQRGYMVTAFGETVSIASRLESATKELLADCLISDEALSASGLMLSGAEQREVHLRGRAKPIKVHAVNEVVAKEPAA